MPPCDRISELPESLLTEILSYLPTKHSVATSALSTRWKNLWLTVPVLDLNCDDFEDEVVPRFIDRLLEFLPRSPLRKVKVKCGSFEINGLKDRIRTSIQRGPQHLEFESCREYLDPDTEFYYPYAVFMPLNLYTSRTLVSLKLTFSGVEDPGFVCMPCLKSMALVEVRFRDDVALEKLVSGCPILEELTLMRDVHSSFVGEVDRFMSVRSGSLKRFRVPLWYGKDCSSLVKCALEIDAPGLEHMILGEDHFDSIVVKNLTSLLMVDLDIKFGVDLYGFFFPQDSSERENFGELFLSGILSVRHMIISEKTVKALELYSKVGMIPKFNNLSRLEAVFPSYLLQFLPAFLECCPNLKHLILVKKLSTDTVGGFVYIYNFSLRLLCVFQEVDYSREMEDAFELTYVPQCFLSTLECVQLKRIHEWEEEEMRVATYFLENAAVLKKLTLSLTDYPRLISDEEIFEEVNKVKKCSPTCQILRDWELC